MITPFRYLENASQSVILSSSQRAQGDCHKFSFWVVSFTDLIASKPKNCLKPVACWKSENNQDAKLQMKAYNQIFGLPFMS